MASTLNSESRHSYSWWWDSHISPKNSKWLQDNLTDIDGKVKSMIKIINEDADSFARRADMYYKKRPELMKLVEEFYRAYRALAERYDHATSELRIAQRTMIEAFPNQNSFMPGDNPDDLIKDSDAGLNKESLNQLNEVFQTGEAILRELKTAEERLRRGNLHEEKGKDSRSKQVSMLPTDKNHNLDLRSMILNQSEQAGKVEAEMQRLKQALAQMEAERDATLAQYHKSLEKLTNLETELNSAQIDAKELDRHATEAQIEVKELKESLKKMEAERDSSLCQFKEASERLNSLEDMVNTAAEAEIEKEGALAQYHDSLKKISELEEKLRLADENAKMCCERNEMADCEIKELKKDLSRLYKEKEDAYLQYQQCLETISKLQNELMELKEEVERLKGEILLGSAQLKCAEEQCSLLEEINQSLNLEAKDLVKEIAAKDKELSEKQTELEKLMNGLQNEQSSFMQIEAMLHSLESMHLRSQDEQRSLLRELEHYKQDLELEIQGLREQNQWLHASVNDNDKQHEIKEKLEVEVKRQSDQNEVLQKQFDSLKEEIEELYKKYNDLLLQVESSGINPKCLKSSIKDLQDENSRLKQISNEGNIEKEGLLRRLQDMESSFADLKAELESSKEKMKALRDSCSALSGEKNTVEAEKTALLSQLKIITDSMQKLLENNITLEKSLQVANIELECLRVKSKGLEDFCQYLKDEKSGLVTERSGLVCRLECVEKNLEDLAKRFTELKDKYVSIEKERDMTRDQVAELRISLSAEKKEHQCLVMSNEMRLSGLEDDIRGLREENKCRKNEFEEQLEKAVNAQVEIFILQKFMKDMEEKHFSLLVECNKHTEAAKYSEKIVSELESENMMQHLEIEYLLDRVENLRRGISQVLKALEIDHVSEGDPEVFLPRVREKVKDIGRSISDGKDENQKLLVQNNVLSTVIMQLSLDGKELKKRKEVVDHEFSLLNQQYVILQSENSGNILELKRVSNEMCHLQEEYSYLTNEARSLEEKMVIKEAENKELRELILQLEVKNQELNVCTDWMFQKCSVERERYNMKEAEFEGLQVQYEDQEKEMVLLREVNGRLENDVIVLSEEVEACKIREVVLGSELHEKSSEFELWEAEATSFYFDLQVSSVREVVLENKVHEISGLYEDLKRKMDAYIPAIISIKDNISSLEQTPVLLKKLPCTSTPKEQVVESKVLGINDCNIAIAKEQTPQQPNDGLLELQELQSRLKTIESILAVEETFTQECVNSTKRKSAIHKTEKLKSGTNTPGTSDLRCRTQMKDIPLDHVADILSSSSGRRGSRRFSHGSKKGSSTHIKTQSRASPSWSDDNMHIELEIGDLFNSNPCEIEKELSVDNLDVSKPGKRSMAVIERLASDAQKLASLQISVQELRRKIETSKKVEHKRIQVQLQHVENSVLQLVNVNTNMAMKMKESSSSSCSMDPTEAIEMEQGLSGDVLDQARRDSEKIGCLQLEMQKIDDKVNNNIIMKSRFSRLHTGIILREFVYNRVGGRRSRKNKNSRFCCFKPSLHREV